MPGVYLIISDFLAESLKASKKWQKRSLILQYIVKRILLQHSQKTYLLYKLSSKHVSGWFHRKNICITPFLDAQEPHSRSTWKANICRIIYIPVRKFLLRRCRQLLSGRELNDFLNTAHCLGLVKSFKLFYFNTTIFHLLILPSIQH